MIPDNRFSSITIKGQLYNPWSRRADVSKHWGPVAIQDPSQGLGVKLWTARVVGADVLISATGVPEFSWYTHSTDIKEVSLAFDQNGRPCVAFVDADDHAFLRWFDPVPNAIVNFDVSAFGGVTPRVTLDDNRPFNGANSDVILGYVRAGIVRFRQQRDRFTVEYTPLIGVGGDPATASALRHISMNSKLRLEFLTNEAGDEPWTLAEVVEDLCHLAGVPPGRTDVRELYDDLVHGLKVQLDEGLHEPLEWLRDMFAFDKSQYDGKLWFPKRGREPVAWIPYTDLVAEEPTALKMTYRDEANLPRFIHINHIDPTGGYAKNKQVAQRRSNMVPSDKSETIDARVVLPPDDAASVAWRKLKAYWNELIDYEFSTTLKWTELTVADVVMVEDIDGVWHRIRLEDRDEDSGLLEWTGVADAGSRAYNMAATGNGLPPPTSSTPGDAGETLIEIINSSPFRDQDDEVGLYVAATGANTAWTGYQLLVSVDNGTSYQEAFRGSVPSTIGEMQTGVAAESGHDIASAETFEVTTNFPLASVTSAQIATGSNRFIMGDEVGQFETATFIDMVGNQYHYELSGLTRAKYGTVADVWPAGTRFVLFDETVAFVQAQRNMIGLDLYYKPVTAGKTEDDTTATAYEFDSAACQTEWAPDNVVANRDVPTDDVTVTWDPRPRLGQFGTPYNSKYFRGWRVKFSDSHTIDVPAGSPASAVYAAAPTGVTVQVCGLNEITGEGPYTLALAT